MDASTVAKHNTAESCWVIVHEKAWDVTDFVFNHPGGSKLILRHAGSDATEDYDAIHGPELIEKTLPASKCQGPVNMSTVSSATQPESSAARVDNAPPSLSAMVSVSDFEKIAEKHLSVAGWAYYSSGADDELSIQESRRVFQRLSLRPRILRDVSSVSTSIDILGCPSSLPIYFSPAGSARYAHQDAERLICRAAGKEGMAYCMPTSPSLTWEDIFGARLRSDQPLFCQLYVNRDIEKAKALIRKAEALGAKGLFVTVDSPVIGNRERDERLTADATPFTPSSPGVVSGGGIAKTGSASLLNPGLKWSDLPWIRETTSLPLVLTGVSSVEDAVMAYQHGVEGIVLSNHGGRSQDTAQAPMLTLLEIRKYAPELLTPPSRGGRKFQVFLDGGVRRGTDVLKALALGATAVGVGRPTLYSMTAGYGEDGLRRLVQILRAELETNMALAGAASVAELAPEMVNTERAERDVSRRVKL